MRELSEKYIVHTIANHNKHLLGYWAGMKLQDQNSMQNLNCIF